MNIDSEIILKYTAATVILIAICLHAFDMYPINVFVHITGAILWTIVGIKWEEGSILLNFVPQIFILGAGLVYYFMGL
jgi:hypothetical protein